MSTSAGPNIVEDGLVLYLDAANENSYPGSGTTWYDLSGNGNNGTLVNGVGYSSDNQGSMVFDGNNYVNLDNFGVSVNNLNELTEIYWFKTNTILTDNGGSILLMFYGDDNDSTPYRPVGNFTSGSPNESISIDGDSVRGHNEQGNTFYHDDIFHQAVFVIGTNFTKIYVDGKELSIRYDIGSSSSGFNAVFSNTVTQWRLGRRTTMGYGYGKPFYMSSHSVYNRALTEAEIKQNFNALRGRYGI